MVDALLWAMSGCFGTLLIIKIIQDFREVTAEQKAHEKKENERRMIDVIGGALQRGNPKIEIDFCGSLNTIEISRSFTSAHNNIVEILDSHTKMFDVLLDELGYKGIWQKDKFVLIKDKRKE